MRLSSEEIQILKSSILACDSKAQIFLYGSRTDDSKKGGDIDLLIISKRLSYDDRLSILVSIFEKMEEQKIDLLIVQDDSDPFVKKILKTGVPL